MAKTAGFIEKTLSTLSDALARDTLVDINARRSGGGLHRLDPRVKVVGMLALVLAAVSAGPLGVVLGIFAVGTALAVFAGVPWQMLVTGAWMPALVFTGPLALPAVFLTPGPHLGVLPWLHWPISKLGLLAAARLVSRAETTATLGLVLVSTTPWAHVLKALRVLRVPAVLVVILGMATRYVFLLLELTREMFEARRSRRVGPIPAREQRRLASATLGVLLGKSLHLSEEVFLAMRSRGFRGEVRTLDDFRMRRGDWWALTGCLLTAGIFGWIGAQ